MPRLIHLNGPPGIGKSTLARMYADDHPGVLNLDIDRLRGLIGGWRDRFGETGAIVRPLALSMAGTHLRGGRDVMMPQFLGRLAALTAVLGPGAQAELSGGYPPQVGGAPPSASWDRNWWGAVRCRVQTHSPSQEEAPRNGQLAA